MSGSGRKPRSNERVIGNEIAHKIETLLQVIFCLRTSGQSSIGRRNLFWRVFSE